jgi:hypothetical protein
MGNTADAVMPIAEANDLLARVLEAQKESGKPPYLSCVRERKYVEKTVEIIPGKMMADYDEDGMLLGIEII